MKQSETWIQIQRYVEMIQFLPFGVIDSKELFETVSKALER